MQLLDELGQDHWVHVVGEDVQKSPVPKHEPVGHILQNVTDAFLEIDNHGVTIVSEDMKQR